MELIKILPKLYMIKSECPYKLAGTFMRLQEFYESPYDDIRGWYFTLETFLDKYSKKGKFTYCDDYCGFNIPGPEVNRFFNYFKHDLTEKEKKLKDLLVPVFTECGTNFYLIGIHRKRDIKHEISHGLFYLNYEYRKEMKELVNSLPKEYYKKCVKNLKSMHYCKEVFIDEIQAYELDKNKRKFMKIYNKFMVKNNLTNNSSYDTLSLEGN